MICIKSPVQTATVQFILPDRFNYIKLYKKDVPKKIAVDKSGKI